MRDAARAFYFAQASRLTSRNLPIILIFSAMVPARQSAIARISNLCQVSKQSIYVIHFLPFRCLLISDGQAVIPNSSLDGPGNHAAYNLLLEDPIENQLRDDDHDAGCHNSAIVDRVGALEK